MLRPDEIWRIDGDTPVLVPLEILYQPKPPSSAERRWHFVASDFQYIKIANLGAKGSLRGHVLGGSVNLTLSPLDLASGEAAYIVAHRGAFSERFGARNIAGTFSGQIPQAGELTFMPAKGSRQKATKYSYDTRNPQVKQGEVLALVAPPKIDTPFAAAWQTRPIFSRLRFDMVTDEKRNRIDFTLPPDIFLSIQNTPEKQEHSKISALVNGFATEAVMRVRGNSTLKYKKKSFNVKLKKKVSFERRAAPPLRLKKFHLLSLTMDKGHHSIKTCFLLLDQLGLMPLASTYAEVFINKATQGIYLATEKPKRVLLKKFGATFVARRLRDGKLDFDSIRHKRKMSNTSVEERTRAFLSIYQLLATSSTFDDGESYRRLHQSIDLKQYMRWMAFNYLVGNADYSDEAYFYSRSIPDDAKTSVDAGPVSSIDDGGQVMNSARRLNERFHVLPWDYDDVFIDVLPENYKVGSEISDYFLAREPREGPEERWKIVGDRPVFSIEDPLDRAIVLDSRLYAEYLRELHWVSHKLTERTVRRIFLDVYQMLIPFYANPATLSNSQHDKYGRFSVRQLQRTMDINFQFLMRRIVSARVISAAGSSYPK